MNVPPVVFGPTRRPLTLRKEGSRTAMTRANRAAGNKPHSGPENTLRLVGDTARELVDQGPHQAMDDGDSWATRRDRFGKRQEKVDRPRNVSAGPCARPLRQPSPPGSPDPSTEAAEAKLDPGAGSPPAPAAGLVSAGARRLPGT